MGFSSGTLATASLAAQSAGAASQAIGGYYSAKRQQDSAGIYDLNARMSESAAQQALQSGQREEQRSMLQTAQLKSRQRVALAANGVDLGSDSAVNVLTSTDVMGEADANTIHANAVRQAFGYRAQAVGYQNEADTARTASPGMALSSGLLTGATAVAKSWYKMNGASPAFDRKQETNGGAASWLR